MLGDLIAQAYRVRVSRRLSLHGLTKVAPDDALYEACADLLALDALLKEGKKRAASEAGQAPEHFDGHFFLLGTTPTVADAALFGAMQLAINQHHSQKHWEVS